MLGRALAGLISLLPLLGAAPAGGGTQPGVFPFRSYGIEDGLGNLSVFSIRQDAEGFLWVGTEDGLYRYDGRRFTRFGGDMKFNVIWDLASSEGGGVWVNTDDGVYHLEGADLVPVPGLPRHQAGFLVLGLGLNAVAAQGRQIYLRRGAEAMAAVRTLPAPVASGWASPDLRTIYAVTETQIWRCQDGDWSVQDLPRGFHGSGSRVLQDRLGRIYLRDRAQFWRRQAWTAPWVDLSAKLPSNGFNPYLPAEDAAGRIWVGTSKGLVCFDGDDAWVLGEDKGLPNGWAGPVFIDREGSLWEGSEGVHRLKGRSMWTNFSTHQGLPAPNVWDIGRSLDGRVFACTDSGVAVLGGETWTLLPGTKGRTLLAGGGNGRDAFWFGGSAKNEVSNSVYRFDLKTGRNEKVPVPPCATTNLILSITSAPDGGIYFGTRLDGVYQVRRHGGGWKTERLPFPGQPQEERVNALRKDPQGRVWAGSEHGLYVLEDGRWTRLGTGEGLLGNNVTGLARDPQGFIWASFLDARGISRVARVAGAWKAVETLVEPAQLFSQLISSLVFDAKGVLWLGTSGGMKRWDGHSVETYDRGDGLISQDPSANGITVDPDGGVWQGFSSGASYFQPRAFQGPADPPRARILEIRDAAREHSLTEPPPRIKYKDHTFTFHFSALSFLNETRIIHEVRLVGLENEWRETQIAEARYPALPDGNYRFEVRSRFRGGPAGPAAGFSFRVLPPWWGTWWFRGLCLLAAAGAVLLGLRRRTAKLSRRNADLERMVALRTEALEVSKVELEKVNRALEEATLVDPLTGLHNRRFLDMSLPGDALQAQRALRELVNAGQDPSASKEDILLFLMDIDHFKAVNDNHGHMAGDQVLRQVSAVLRGCTRASDSLVRWGGEEFLLVARRTRRQGAAAIANGLLEAIRGHVFQLPEGVELLKTWSIGFCALPVHPRHPEVGDWQQALKMADQCLYAAKNTGRDRWVGALMPAEADISALADLKTWDVGWALERGLMQVVCSDPAFRWPEGSEVL